jgi:hypothetical protein
MNISKKIQVLKSIKLIINFYKNFVLASSIITIACLFIFEKYGIRSFGTLFLFKIVTLGMLYYYINKTKANEFYYYQNLGISKTILWSSSLIFDFVIFIVPIVLIA